MSYFYKNLNMYRNLTSLTLILLSQAALLAQADLLDDFVNTGPEFVKYELLPQYDYSGEGSPLTPTFGKSWTARCVNLTSQV